MSEASPPARILVVDDHEWNRRLLARILEREGYEIDAVGSLAAARQVAQDRRPNLVVLDLHLSDGDGLELLPTLSRGAHGDRPRVLACTAAAEATQQRRALTAGCDAYVSKPIDTHEFAALVRSLLASAVPPVAGFSVTARR